VRYRQPRRVNVVSIALLALLAAVGYGVVQFGPPCWRLFQVKEVLQDAASRYLGRRSVNEASNMRSLVDDIRDEAERKIKNLGLEDQSVRVDLHESGDELTVEAKYKEIIRHPWVSKVTVLNCNPRFERNLDR